MPENKTSAKRLAELDRQRKALELRKAGAGYEEIARQLDYRGPSGAYYAVKAALDRTLQQPADELRALEAARLDAMLLGVWADARKGGLKQVDRVLRIMERRARLLGLDAPTTLRIVQEEAERLAAELGLSTAEILAEAEAIVAGSSR